MGAFLVLFGLCDCNQWCHQDGIKLNSFLFQMLTSLTNFIASTLYNLNPNNDLSYYQKEALRIVAIEQVLAKV